jgi:carbamoyl-phosphate synthase large subunit
LEGTGVALPEYYYVKSIDEFKKAAYKLDYPKRIFCFKPSLFPTGSGKGFRIVTNNHEWVYRNLFEALTSKLYTVTYDYVITAMENMKDFPPLLVMEYLEGDEFSVYAFCSDGNAEYIVPNLKKELDETNTKSAIVVKDKAIIESTRRIVRAFGFDYNINIQFKKDANGIPKLIEINPRVAGTITLPIAAGVDLLKIMIDKALKRDYPKNIRIRYGTEIRRILMENYYFNGKRIFTL